MKLFTKQHKRQAKINWKEGYLLVALMLLLIMACTEVLEDGGPLGPSGFTFRITSTSVSVAKSGTNTFTTFNGTAPIFWSLSNTPIGTIDANTGIFTASATIAGSATVTATDSKGQTATATITVLPTQLTVTPATVTLDTAGTQNFVVTGHTLAAGGSLHWSISKDTSTSTLTLGSTNLAAVDATGTVTVTFTIPSTEETFTVSITDSNGDVGTAKLVLTPP